MWVPLKGPFKGSGSLILRWVKRSELEAKRMEELGVGFIRFGTCVVRVGIRFNVERGGWGLGVICLTSSQ